MTRSTSPSLSRPKTNRTMGRSAAALSSHAGLVVCGGVSGRSSAETMGVGWMAAGWATLATGTDCSAALPLVSASGKVTAKASRPSVKVTALHKAVIIRLRNPTVKRNRSSRPGAGPSSRICRRRRVPGACLGSPACIRAAPLTKPSNLAAAWLDQSTCPPAEPSRSEAVGEAISSCRVFSSSSRSGRRASAAWFDVRAAMIRLGNTFGAVLSGCLLLGRTGKK